MKHDTKLKQVTIKKLDSDGEHTVVSWIISAKAKVGNSFEGKDAITKEPLIGRWEIVEVNEDSETEYNNIAHVNPEDIWKTQPIRRGNK